MAGVTREAKAAAERLPDRISLGVLALTFPNALLDEVIEEADAREVRYRRLPARLMLVFTLACWLFMRSGHDGVLAKLTDAYAGDGQGWGDWQAPWSGSITKAKARLGPRPLRLLFARTTTATPLAAGQDQVPGLVWRGLRVATVDGFTLDVPATDANAEHFGRGGNGSDQTNPYPQLRALVLAEGGTRRLLAATFGPSTTGEKTLARDLLPALHEEMIVLADRNFPSWSLWRAAAGTGAQLCWRISASFPLPVEQVLPDGSYLSRLNPPRKKDGPPITIRVIEYSVVTTGPDGTQVSEVFALATTLHDDDAYPALELAQLYHARWQAEVGIGEIKNGLRGGPEVVLRSKTPAGVEQEFWALMCVYQAIRNLIRYAAPAGLDPGRVSFTHAADAARDALSRALSPQPS